MVARSGLDVASDGVARIGEERIRSAAEPLTVVYVTGVGRSGTTIFSNVLNEIEGWFNAGELSGMWKHVALGEDGGGTCGCGRCLLDCPVWSRILDTEVEPGMTLAAWAPVIATSMRERFRNHHTWRLLRRRLDAASAADVRTLGVVYRAIQAATGARVIVDTSKEASGAAALFRIEGITPRVVHMVRDPRAVAYAWRRPKMDLVRIDALKSTWHWLSFNLAAESVNRCWPHSALRLRYEDFVADPEAAVARVLRLVGEPVERSPVRRSVVVLNPNHTVQGNPNRFVTGAVQIREDDAWRTGITAGMAVKVSALALPQLRRYGYPAMVRPRRDDRAPSC